MHIKLDRNNFELRMLRLLFILELRIFCSYEENEGEMMSLENGSIMEVTLKNLIIRKFE